MKFAPIYGLLLLAGLTSCTSYKYVAIEDSAEHKDTDAYKNSLKRTLASVGEEISSEEKLQDKISSLTEGVVDSYVYGQVLLEDFDKQLEANPQEAMKSDTYAELLSVRVVVDEIEHDLGDIHQDLKQVQTAPEFTAHEKENAEQGLKKITEFLNGKTSNGETLPANLQPLVLQNIQGQLGHPTKKFKSNSGHYQVDESELQRIVDKKSKDENFINYKKRIKSLSKDVKSFMTELKGRETSSDVIFPATGSAGNITGRTFPRNTWSITYDDGPGSRTTPTVVQNLANKNVKATFFMLAKQVEAMPTLSKRIADAGHDIASHSYTHAQLTKVGPAALEKEIGRAKTVIENHTGKKLKLFRLPYGAGTGSASVRAKIVEHNLIHVFWNVDTLDWQDKNPQSIVERSLRQMRASSSNSGVILFHDIHSQSVTASNLLIEKMKADGLTICTVQGVVDQLNKNLRSCK